MVKWHIYCIFLVGCSLKHALSSWWLLSVFPDILRVFANFHLAVCVPRIGFTSSFRRYHELASFSWSKTFAHEPVISQGSRGISFVLPPVMRGQEREPCHRSQCRFALPLLTVRSEKRKDVSCLSHRDQKEEASSKTSWRASADVAGIPPARAAIWGSPAEYSRSAWC